MKYALFLLLCVLPCLQAEELIENGDFSKGKSKWSRWI